MKMFTDIGKLMTLLRVEVVETKTQQTFVRITEFGTQREKNILY